MKQYNRTLKKILVVAFIMTIISAALLTFQSVQYSLNFFSRIATTQFSYVGDTDNFLIESNVSKVVVKSTINSLNIVYSNSNTGRISYPVNLVTIEQNGSELIVDYKDKWHNSWGINWFDTATTATIVIELPRTVSALTIDSSVGNTMIRDITLNNLSINASVGNTTIRDTTVTNAIAIDNGIGETTLANVKGAATLHVNGGVGNINVEQMTVESITIDGGVGNTNLNNITANTVHLVSGIGNIFLKHSVINRLTGKAGLGKISIDSSNKIATNEITPNSIS